MLNQTYTLPGIGSYVAAAVASRNLSALGMAIAMMAVVILLVDQLFWRPLVAWSDRFRMEQSGGGEAIQSWLFDLMRRARIVTLVSEWLAPLSETVDRMLSTCQGRVRSQQEQETTTRQARLSNWGVALLVGMMLSLLIHFIFTTVGPPEVLRALWMGVHTLGRVCRDQLDESIRGRSESPLLAPALRPG